MKRRARSKRSAATMSVQRAIAKQNAKEKVTMNDQNKAEVVRLARKGMTAEEIVHRMNCDPRIKGVMTVRDVQAELDRLTDATQPVDETRVTTPEEVKEQEEHCKCDWCGASLLGQREIGAEGSGRGTVRVMQSWHWATGGQEITNPCTGEEDSDWDPINEYDLCDDCNARLWTAWEQARNERRAETSHS